MGLILYVATTNPGKLRDFAVAAREYATAFEFAALPGIDGIPSPVEDEPTFAGNATKKAIAYSLHAPGYIVLADDSGLEVDALADAPGVRSARYAVDAEFHPNPSDALSIDACNVDARNNLLLLKNLRQVPLERRTARYRCVLAAARDGLRIALAKGSVEGTILAAPRGSGGFGYDPLFFLPPFGRTMSEITLEEKLTISHRGQALRALLKKLSS